MSKLIIALCLLGVMQTAQSNVEPRLSCSKNGSMIFFINGVNVSEVDKISNKILYDRFFERMTKDRIDQKLDVDSKFLYNQSEGLLLDAYETYKLSLEHSTTPKKTKVRMFLDMISGDLPDFLQTCRSHEGNQKCDSIFSHYYKGQASLAETDLRVMMARVLRAAKDNKKLIFVTHSGGTIFADAIRRHLKTYYPQYYKLSSHFSMSRPFKTDLNKTFNATFDQDEIGKFLRYSFPALAPSANIVMYQKCKGNVTEAPNHIQTCYFEDAIQLSFLNTSDRPLFNQSFPIRAIDYMLDSVYRVATFIPGNDEKCCPTIPGGPWRNEHLCQSGSPNCLSGFVADSVEYSKKENIEIVKSYICGPYKLHPGNNKIQMYGSYLHGQGEINKGNISDSIFKEDSITSFSGYAIGNSELSGRNVIQDDVYIFNSQLNGNNIIKGHTEFSRSTLSSDLLNPSSFDGSIGISDSHLEGNFNVSGSATISNSSLIGTNILQGNTLFHSVTSEGIIRSSTNLTNSSILQEVTNFGELYLENRVAMRNVSFSGKNTLKNNVTSVNVSVPFGLIFTGENYVSGNMTFWGSPQTINNLHSENTTTQESLFRDVSWLGNLTLNGSVNIQAVELGEDVTITSFRGPYQNLYNVEIWNSTIESGLNLYETGSFQNCDFFGSGSSYTHACNKTSDAFVPVIQ